MSYRWRVEGVGPESVIDRLCAATDGRVEHDFRIAPLDPAGPGKLGRPGGFLVHVDDAGEVVRLGMRAGDGRLVFAPVLELELRREGDDTVVRGTIKREYPDAIVGLLGVGLLSTGFGVAIGLLLALAGMFLAGGAAIFVGLGLFASVGLLSGVALRAVNTRVVHESLVHRVGEALEAPAPTGYRG